MMIGSPQHQLNKDLIVRVEPWPSSTRSSTSSCSTTSSPRQRP